MAGVRRREAGPVSSSSSSRGERRRVVIGGGGGGGGGMMTKAALACVAMVAVSALVLTAEAFWVGPYHPGMCVCVCDAWVWGRSIR